MTAVLDYQVYHAPMGSRGEITKLADVRPVARCPQCSSPTVVRRATGSTYGDSYLYELMEQCSMCGWTIMQTNVKVI